MASTDESSSWDPSQAHPPIRSVLFSREATSLAYLGDPAAAAANLPRGAFVYSTDHLTDDGNEFTVEIVSLGELTDESGAVTLSIGLAPLTDKKDTWAYPNGSIFLHNTGRAVHYNGSNLMQWRSIRLDRSLNPGDRVTVTFRDGRVMFSLNGVTSDQCFDDVTPEMYPVVHIQKKGVRIKANFGKKNATNSNLAVAAKEPRTTGQGSKPGAGHRRSTVSSGRPALRSKTLTRYNPQLSKNYLLPTTGQAAKSGNPDLPIFDLESDDDESDDDDEGVDDDLRNREDVNSLLVKAWETNVFPAIRSSFIFSYNFKYI